MQINLKGKLLIAEPTISDKFFFKSVIFIVHHDDNECIGFILNKRIELKIKTIIDNISTNDNSIYIGGPVSKNTIHYIHNLGNQILNSKKVCNNLYWGGDFQQIKLLLKDNKINEGNIRFFIGYSGWSSFQIENELKQKSWLIKNTTDDIFSKYKEVNDLWRTYIKRDSEYYIWSNMPNNPMLN